MNRNGVESVSGTTDMPDPRWGVDRVVAKIKDSLSQKDRGDTLACVFAYHSYYSLNQAMVSD